ncbi:MAG: adenylosuccinate lyase [Deltaproteobacteria bacterium]|nr:adenylosuccinate lyase [Deltaproteobacteria bacterium]NNK86324.1 adenylosuccinate lyase [Desulfobacterales bacterium]
MDISFLKAISPVDGRYQRVVRELSDYFSEGALIKYRVFVEIEYFIALCDIPLPQLENFDKGLTGSLRSIYEDFSDNDGLKVKNIEKITNHDVKAVEYFLKERFDEMGLGRYKEFIHFGLTSQDINNTAVPYSMKKAYFDILKPALDESIDVLGKKAVAWKNIPMLARTHGQPASPTSLGKEIYVFVDRLLNQTALLKQVPFSAKFGGATGNFNAHQVAYPNVDWISFGDHFIKNILGLERLKVTTQIEHYDNLAAFFDNIKRINTVFIDLNRDIWSYISINYFKQKLKKGEVGSSVMPHKVNPIDFENSEGNLGIANAMFEHLSAKLPVSRLQRDLTDSTVTRNIGVPFAHTLIALKSFLKGFNKLLLNEKTIRDDLNNNWAVVAEAIQTILRREGYPKPYEALKELTRTHTHIDQKIIANFIKALDVNEKVKEELNKITPENYTGVYGF